MAELTKDVQVYDDVPITRYQDFGEVVAAAERAVEAVNRCRQVVMKLTRENDWVLMSGQKGQLKPYLQSTGAEAVARLFRVAVTGIKPERREGIRASGKPFTEYLFQGEFSLPDGTSITAIGSRESDDPFFAAGAARQSREVKDRDVRNAAYTNMFVNGVTRLLGIRNITLDELKAAGLNPAKMPGVEYRGSGPAAGAEGAPAGDKPEPDLADEMAVKKVAQIIRMVAGKDPEAMVARLQEVTAFGDYTGRTSFRGRWSKKQAQIAYAKAKEKIDAGEWEVAFDTEGNPAHAPEA